LAAGILSISIAEGPQARAGDIKITLPKRSHLTPVQRLNQEGVAEIHKRSYEKSSSVFSIRPIFWIPAIPSP